MLVVQRARLNELVSSVDLGVWRTPVEPARRLGERIGLRPDDLWVKRDDWLGFGGGGNKLRKLASPPRVVHLTSAARPSQCHIERGNPLVVRVCSPLGPVTRSRQFA